MRADRRGGFTLLEVLIAFTICAIALTALMEIFSTGLRSAAAARTVATAALLARSKLATLGTEHAITPGETTGRLEGGFGLERGFDWVVVATPLPALGGEDTGIVAFEVSVTVRPTGAHDMGRAVGITSLRLVPAPPSAERP
jgi:prepilin-type N-terminal cleavage/methylation domain-containing protein